MIGVLLTLQLIVAQYNSTYCTYDINNSNNHNSISTSNTVIVLTDTLYTMSSYMESINALEGNQLVDYSVYKEKYITDDGTEMTIYIIIILACVAFALLINAATPDSQWNSDSYGSEDLRAGISIAF